MARVGWMRVACVGLLLWLSGATYAGAAPLDDEAVQAVQAVVKAQLDALAANDPARAFSFASPAIRAQFGDAPTFMAMVRGGYPMLIAPRATSFLLPRAEQNLVVQRIRVRDHADRRWLATYVLERQADRHFLIAGCAVVADDAEDWT